MRPAPLIHREAFEPAGTGRPAEVSPVVLRLGAAIAHDLHHLRSRDLGPAEAAARLSALAVTARALSALAFVQAGRLRDEAEL